MRKIITPQKPKTSHVIIQNHSKRASQVSADIEAFLNRGGKVESVDAGITGFEDLHTPNTYNNMRKH
ncbi:hypothetical protein [Marinicellulosiphila megalodicopiae]|uniref:hypothetical protein n=1 Tax=Marinicellulosiphila megalodicopiae TaxID=2724896 RepID=UPI003BB1D487